MWKLSIVVWVIVVASSASARTSLEGDTPATDGKGKMCNGERCGEWTFGPKHRPVSAGFFKDGLMDGRWRFTCGKEVFGCEGFYTRGRQHEWNFVNKHGARFQRIRITRSGEDRWMREVFNNGKLVYKEEIAQLPQSFQWKPDQAVSVPQSVIAYGPGKCQAMAPCCHGTFTHYFGGKAGQTGECNEGLWHGEMQQFFADGSVQWTQTYLENKLTGPAVKYFAGGHKEWEGVFKDGVEDGPWTWWHRNGSAAIKADYNEGRRHGAWASWHENGKKRCAGRYANDLQSGSWTCRHPNGRKSFTASYADGKPDGRWRAWFQNGKKAAQGKYHAGKATGKWSRWHENGKRAAKGRLVHFGKKEVDLCLQIMAIGGAGPLPGGSCGDRLGPVFNCHDLKGQKAWQWSWWDQKGSLAVRKSGAMIHYEDGLEGPGGATQDMFSFEIDEDFAKNNPTVMKTMDKRLKQSYRRWRHCHARSVEKGPERWWFGSATIALSIDADGQLHSPRYKMPAVDVEFEQCFEQHLPRLGLPAPQGKNSRWVRPDSLTIKMTLFSSIPVPR